jgi:catechol 2,3-dioxygenase-like lactoylglutathione lyase family enzyme
MNFRQIKETCVYVRNLHSTEKFYTEVLGLEKIGEVENRHVFFRVGSSVLLFFNAEATKADDKLPPHYASGKMHFAIEVSQQDYNKVKSTLENKGVAIEHEHKWRDNVHSFYFRDPDDHLLEIVPEGMWDIHK